MAEQFFYARKGDTLKTLVGTCMDEAGAFDLTGCTLQFFMRLRTYKSTNKVNGSPAIASPDQVANKGVFSYSWGATDLDAPGEYDARLVATIPSGGQLTFPNNERDRWTIVVHD